MQRVPAVAKSTSPDSLTPKIEAWLSSGPLARVPYFSVALLIVLTALFMVELNAGPIGKDGAPTYGTLVAMGGVSRALVFKGEIWRLFTAPLLHGSWSHLLSNGFVLVLNGFFLEPIIGRRWYAATFAIGAVAGAIASISLNDPNIISVGASGGIMSLLGATFVCSFGDTVGERRAKWMRRLTYRLLIPSLIPLAAQVDTSAHLGGAAAGGCIGFFLQIVWPEGEARPQHAGIAGMISAACAALAVLAFGLTSFHFDQYASVKPPMAAGLAPELNPDDLIPADQLAGDPRSIIERGDDLVARWPKDPRAHMYHALHFRMQGDMTDEEDELRQALALDHGEDQLARFIKLELGFVLVHEGRVPEAKTVAGPECDYARELEADGEAPEDMRALFGAGVCG